MSGRHNWRERVRIYWTWRRQGRPTHVPVPVKVGKLAVYHWPDGQVERSINDWDFDCRYMEPRHCSLDDPGFMSDLWEHLADHYPILVDHLEGPAAR